jgi:transcriptional antiterminator NusG
LGDPENYVEPFAGSAAMLLGRPNVGKIETINDADGFVANFWRAVSLDAAEVESLFKRMDADQVKHKIDFITGEAIQITDGPFKDFEGKIAEIDRQRGKIKVLVSMFGRDTAVELDFLQVKKV